MKPEFIRNIAIIAHVDHGKTTLVDAFLKQSNVFRENQEEMQQEQILDSGELEREKGITINAKTASIYYKDYKINIIDTPGHADFGGEVERTLNMADGCLLIVDAQEGPMPQTKFVLRKALELNLQPIVVVNKIDKPYADPQSALDAVNNLFLQLVSDIDQLDFPVIYAIGRDGKAFATMPDDFNQPGDMQPLLEAITAHIPAPQGDIDGPFQMQITSVEYDQHLGRLLMGKVRRGRVKPGDSLLLINKDKKSTGRVKKVLIRESLAYKEVETVGLGELVAITGIDTTAIGATLCDPSKPEALPDISISNPAVKIKFEANTSPLTGKDGEFVTPKQVQQRLDKEAETNISLKITKGDGGAYYVAGRGELQLSILIETMRREGYEFQVKRPEVVMIEEGGLTKEPIEELIIDVPTEYQGEVTSGLGERKAEMLSMDIMGASTRFTYKLPTRNLLGLRNQLLTATKGTVVLNNTLIGYQPYIAEEERFKQGVLVATEAGKAAGYALNTIQERGTLFIQPATEVYEGMIVGINKYENDLEVNVTKEREKSGVRRSSAEVTDVSLKKTKELTLDFALLFLHQDEILEVTPKNLRLRKELLTRTQRDWAKRSNLHDLAKKQLGIS